MKHPIILNLILLLAVTTVATAQIRHVPDEYLTIQAAIDVANDGDEIIVADGVYTGDCNRDLFINGDITIRSENGPDGCIIDCNGTKSEPHRGLVLTGIVL